MTHFEEFAIEVLGKIDIGNDGMYAGLTNALAKIATEVILSDDEEVFNLDWDSQKKLILDKFYGVFPYLRR